MEFNIEDLSKLNVRVSTVCRDYEPWADMMYWSGGGDHGAYDFPLDPNQIERIDITRIERVEEPQESVAS